jgi:hypothetical protein
VNPRHDYATPIAFVRNGLFLKPLRLATSLGIACEDMKFGRWQILSGNVAHLPNSLSRMSHILDEYASKKRCFPLRKSQVWNFNGYLAAGCSDNRFPQNKKIGWLIESIFAMMAMAMNSVKTVPVKIFRLQGVHKTFMMDQPRPGMPIPTMKKSIG